MPEPRPRSPWIAALLSAVVWPGLGQLYNGRVARCLAIVIGFPVAVAAVLVLAMRAGATLPLVAAAVAVIVSGWAAAVADAYRDARRRAAPRPWYTRWFAVLAASLLNALVLSPLWARAWVRTAAATYQTPGGGMEPTLMMGDRFLMDATAYGYRRPLAETPSYLRRPPARGDIAVFLSPVDPRMRFVKRVVGLPGETVAIHEGVVQVNGAALAEPYARLDETPGARAETRTWGPEAVPHGHYWVLGDNRDHSKDSRYWGFVPESHLIGRVALVYLSLKQDPGGRVRGIRWNRFGYVPR
jgi:signal peptidase I